VSLILGRFDYEPGSIGISGKWGPISPQNTKSAEKVCCSLENPAFSGLEIEYKPKPTVACSKGSSTGSAPSDYGQRRVLFTVLQRNTSRQRGVRSSLRSSPHHSIGRTPAQSPSCGGALLRTFEIGRACKGLRVPTAIPTIPKGCPHAEAIGTPPHVGFLKSRCDFLWPELWRRSPIRLGKLLDGPGFDQPTIG
jgi:hypothetical protein